MKAEEEKKCESESSDSEEDNVINLNLILNLPEEKVIKTKIAEKIDRRFFRLLLAKEKLSKIYFGLSAKFNISSKVCHRH